MQRFFDNTVKEYETFLVNYAKLIIADEQDAMFVVNTSFLAFQRKIDTEGEDSIKNIKSYLMTAVRNTAINFQNKKKKQAVYSKEISHTITDENPNKERQIITMEKTEENKKQIFNAIKKLPPKERIAIILRTKNYDLDGIADEMDITYQAAAQLLSRARKKLKVNLLDKFKYFFQK